MEHLSRINVKFLNRLVTLKLKKFQPFGILKLENVNVINHSFNSAKLLLQPKIMERQNWTLISGKKYLHGGTISKDSPKYGTVFFLKNDLDIQNFWLSNNYRWPKMTSNDLEIERIFKYLNFSKTNDNDS